MQLIWHQSMDGTNRLQKYLMCQIINWKLETIWTIHNQIKLKIHMIDIYMSE